MLESLHDEHRPIITWLKKNPTIPQQQLNTSRISKDVLCREILFSEDKGNDLKATHEMNTPFQLCTCAHKPLFSFLVLLQ